VVQVIGRVEQAVRELPSQQKIAWGGKYTAHVEDVLNEWQPVQDGFAIR
jgi:hypothetical protein